MKTLRNLMGYALAVAMIFGATPVAAKRCSKHTSSKTHTGKGAAHKKNKGTALKKHNKNNGASKKYGKGGRRAQQRQS